RFSVLPCLRTAVVVHLPVPLGALLAPAGTCGRVGRLAAPVVPVGQGGLVLLVARLVILDKLGVLGVQGVVALLKRPFGVPLLLDRLKAALGDLRPVGGLVRLGVHCSLPKIGRGSFRLQNRPPGRGWIPTR